MATLSSEPSFKDVMSQASSIEWDLRSPEVQSDQLASYDAMRSRCPVAHTPDDSWVVFRHSDTVRILDDPETFSNEVSAHLAVPSRAISLPSDWLPSSRSRAQSVPNSSQGWPETATSK